MNAISCGEKVEGMEARDGDAARVRNRIIVIGCPGAGKSTFARRLRDRTGLPLFHLDMIHHRPDRTTVPREEFDAALAGILAGERWIVDGNYRRTIPLRMEKCEQAFLFDLPTEECLKGAEARVGTVREDMPWTEETLDPEFRQFILDFRKEQLPAIYDLMEQYRGKRDFVVFRSHEECGAWLESLPSPFPNEGDEA